MRIDEINNRVKFKMDAQSIEELKKLDSILQSRILNLANYMKIQLGNREIKKPTYKRLKKD